MSTIPDKGPSLHPAMDNMTVADNGVCKLLRNLNIQKASGPAEIPTRLTKEHAENLALISKCLEQHGLLTDAQHGIRKNRSCESQLILTVHDLAKSMDLENQTDLILLDFPHRLQLSTPREITL